MQWATICNICTQLDTHTSTHCCYTHTAHTATHTHTSHTHTHTHTHTISCWFIYVWIGLTQGEDIFATKVLQTYALALQNVPSGCILMFVIHLRLEAPCHFTYMLLCLISIDSPHILHSPLSTSYQMFTAQACESVYLSLLGVWMKKLITHTDRDMSWKCISEVLTFTVTFPLEMVTGSKHTVSSINHSFPPAIVTLPLAGHECWEIGSSSSVAVIQCPTQLPRYTNRWMVQDCEHT